MGLARTEYANASKLNTIIRAAFASVQMPQYTPHAFRKTLTHYGNEVCKGPEAFMTWSMNLGHESVAAWLVEVRAGVYVGDYSARTRGMIWDQVLVGLDAGDAVLVWRAATDQGYDFLTAGANRRMPEDFDGLKLVSFYPQKPG